MNLPAPPPPKKKPQLTASDHAVGVLVLGGLVLLFGGCVRFLSAYGSSDTKGVMAEFGPFTEAQARLFCKDEMKRKLRDPGSLRIEDVRIVSQDGHLGTAAIDYQAKNGFGGMNRSTAICKKYKNPNAGGRVYIKVSL